MSSDVQAAPPTPTKPKAPYTFRRRAKDWIGTDEIEDFSLRYAPQSFRKWTPLACAVSALGGIAYLADFSIGAAIAVTHGVPNAIVAILVAAVTIFLTGIPISYYAAKYNIDMDLLTRGAGFGYFGSTLTSLIYASFCFIFFALEGAIMGQALALALGIPLWVSYLISSLGIIPVVVFGMAFLSKLQMWTQPLWIILIAAPFVAILVQDGGAYDRFLGWTGDGGSDTVQFVAVGAGAGVALSLIAQIGEQIDYLRFMPERSQTSGWRWWGAVLAAGPGWVVLGALKQIGGAFLAFYIFTRVGPERATEPVEQFVSGFGFLNSDTAALAVAAILVVLSQVKINVTNAYSGSLSWSNFFSRVLHAHPGRVVWLLFHLTIATTLMLVGVFGFLNSVLGFYSNVAIAWIGALTADLVINKPLLKLSPSYVEFKRSYLHTINPVGFGAMVVGSVFSIAAFFGAFGPTLDAWSPFLALAIAMVLSPLIAVATKGRYYVARTNPLREGIELDPERAAETMVDVVDGRSWELPDMIHDCPFHGGPISSLTCTLTKGCHDQCKLPAAETAMVGAGKPASTA